jgi:hypothetical protein
VQRAPGDERVFRVPYGDGDLEFMLQPWFDIDVAAVPGREYDIVIAGVGKGEGGDLRSATGAALRARPHVRDGGAIVFAAQLDEGEGDATPPSVEPLLIVAASESPEIVRLAGMRAAVDVEEALDIAYEHIGRPTRASVLLLQDPPRR